MNMSRKILQPSDWNCPGCGKHHTKAHWKDYHQKEPGWKGKLGKHSGIDKQSSDQYRIICEVCEGPLVSKSMTLSDKKPDFCEKCKTTKTGKYCAECGTKLKKRKMIDNWCNKCNKQVNGIPAGLFCPHCGWDENRVVLVKDVD